MARHQSVTAVARLSGPRRGVNLSQILSVGFWEDFANDPKRMWKRTAWPSPGAVIRRYCFDAVQLPTHPSERRYEPEPLRPEKRPELVQETPPAAPAAAAEPFGLT